MSNQDWMSFLSAFVDEIKNLAVKFEARELSQEEVIDVAGSYFVQAHKYEEPKLHEAMRNAWENVHTAMLKLLEDWAVEKGKSEEEIYRMYAQRIFRNPMLIQDARIPQHMRARYWYMQEMSMRLTRLH